MFPTPRCRAVHSTVQTWPGRLHELYSVDDLRLRLVLELVNRQASPDGPRIRRERKIPLFRPLLSVSSLEPLVWLDATDFSKHFVSPILDAQSDMAEVELAQVSPLNFQRYHAHPRFSQLKLGRTLILVASTNLVLSIVASLSCSASSLQGLLQPAHTQRGPNFTYWWVSAARSKTGVGVTHVGEGSRIGGI